jgi:plasmid stabilization system protein ParE
MKLRWSKTALSRLVEIEEYISQHNPAAGEQFVNRLVGRAEKLTRFPRQGRVVPELRGSEIREVVERGYRILYRYSDTEIEVVTVFEGHRLMREEEL